MSKPQPAAKVPVTIPVTSKDIIAQLEKAQADLARLATVTDILPAAVTRIEEIRSEIVTAEGQLAEALADEAMQARAKMLEQFSNISVAVKHAGDTKGILAATFYVTWDKLAYDMAAKENLPKTYKCTGFDALPDDVWDYLLDVKPEAIPAEIMELSPGNPREAFQNYFACKRKGYVSV